MSSTKRDQPQHEERDPRPSGRPAQGSPWGEETPPEPRWTEVANEAAWEEGPPLDAYALDAYALEAHAEVGVVDGGAGESSRGEVRAEVSDRPERSQGELLAEIYSGLNSSQRRAVELLEGPVLVVAGAGSGKTRVLTRRIAAHIARGAAPEEILAITFTNKAAAEMRVRVGELVGAKALDRMWVSTFHSACVRMLRMKGPERWFSVLDSSDSQKVVRSVLEDLGYEKETLAGGFVRKVAGQISRSKNHLVAPKPDGKGGVADAAAEVYAGYQAALRRMKAYDFDDLLVETVRMLSADDGEALAYFQNKFKYILVDEYQDTNRAQYAIVALLARRHRNICVVGDQAQSIYMFRGATVENIRRFERDWPGAQVVVLAQNYRSTKKILEVANVIRAGMEEGSRTELWTDGSEGEPVRIYVAGDDRGEAQMVCRRVRELGRPGDHAVLYRTNAQSRPFEEALMAAGIPYKIVGGTRFYDRAEIKDALGYLRFCTNPTDMMAFARIANTPRRGLGDSGMAKITDVAERENVDLLEAARRARSAEDVGRAGPAIGRFVQFCEKVLQTIDTEGPGAALEVVLLGVDGSRKEFREKIASGLSPERAMIDAMGKTGQGAMYTRFGDEKEAERLQNLFELGRAAAEFESGTAPATLVEGGSLLDLTPRERTEAYLEHATLVSDLDEALGGGSGGDEGEGAVLLMTMHAAKGLEFPHVTVVGMEDGLLPLRFGRGFQSPEEKAEERRLAYVAVTRAEETLCLARAERRMLYGSIVEHPESEFLGEVIRALAIEVEESGASTSGAMRHNWGSQGGGRYREYWGAGGKAQRAGGAPGGRRGASAGGGRPESPTQQSTRVTTGRRPDLEGPPAGAEKTFEKPVVAGLGPGVVVSHSRFGRGVIVSIEGSGEEMVLKVRFEVGVKSLLAKYAGLEIV